MKRRATIILASDVVSFSRLLAENEEETLQRLTTYRRTCESFVLRHEGRIFNTAGDSIMCEFKSPLHAVRAAVDIQEAIRGLNLAFPPNRWLQFRIGIASGEVVDRDGELMGMPINIAARLEKLAKPGGVCISDEIHKAASGGVSVPFIDLGERTVKNIPFPVHAFAIAWPGTAFDQDRSEPAYQRQYLARWAALACATALVVASAVAGWQLADQPADPDIAFAVPSPAQQAAQALVRSTDPTEAFLNLSQKGGLIEDARSAPGLYYKALLFEAKGETSGAHRAYYALARMGLDFVDPHLRYAALVNAHEGKAMARQVYAELQEDAPTRSTALLHALQFEGAERITRLDALIAKHPDFAPAYYFLAKEHSEERLGQSASPRDRQIELAALNKFLKSHRQGRLMDFFLDHAIAAVWVDKARKRRDKLETSLKSVSAMP
ncbi:adenylate/guanylate cyclase domain-containing protein [Microvirga sp. 2YAF29]|uniref:adenylate/guanylate cyclase domain-containing protein n=1 Tax=Microvirga sp. 2YAF29 TaxID=3233031 RepID=UPI003F9E6F1F